MTTNEPAGYWAKHYHDAYLQDAANPKYPLAIRVAFLAYGTHKANGHARFKGHEVANVLGAMDETGTFVPASKWMVQRAIRNAVEWGLLAAESKALCLIVPGHRIRGGAGDPEAPCDRHVPRKGATGRTVLAQKGADPRALSVRNGATGRTVSRSAPSTSLLQPVRQDRNTTRQPDTREAS